MCLALMTLFELGLDVMIEFSKLGKDEWHFSIGIWKLTCWK